MGKSVCCSSVMMSSNLHHSQRKLGMAAQICNPSTVRDRQEDWNTLAAGLDLGSVIDPVSMV